MKIHELETTSNRNRRRVGRGISAGQGKTAGRGTKGQNARTGGGVRVGFEGGQNPLMHRVPKRRGFKSMRAKAAIIHTDQLNQLTGDVTVDVLVKAGLIDNAASAVKLLKRGEVKKKFMIEGIEVSNTAATAVIKAGGSIKSLAKQNREKASK